MDNLQSMMIGITEKLSSSHYREKPVIKYSISAMYNHSPLFILDFLDELNLAPSIPFETAIKLVINGRQKIFDATAVIHLYDSYFELELQTHENINPLPKVFNSIENIFTIDGKGKLAFACITQAYSFKAILSLKY